MTDVDRYDYDLPRELIAQHPLAQRTDARLMVVDSATERIEHCRVRDLRDWLHSPDALVLNDTRVVLARLTGFRTRTGGRWTGLFLARDEHECWRVLGKTRGKMQPGETITLQDRRSQPGLRLQLLSRLGDGSWTAVPESSEDTWTLIERYGRVPLPPYIRHGRMMDADTDDYQTVFARHPGAVAAPTAGLHFTTELLDALARQGIEISFVTLHVGPGTFRPITSVQLEQHSMYAEWGRVEPEVVTRLGRRRALGGRIVAVGTTVARALETAARGGELEPWEGETDLFIRPPYTFRAVDALITNFHLPRSTLLVLVSAFAGERLMRRAYQLAIAEGYRFYSYGDAMLIL